MSTFTSAFLISFLGALFASLIVHMLDTRFRGPKPTTDAMSRAYPRSGLLRVAAYVIFAAWAALAGMAVLLFLSIFFTQDITPGFVALLALLFLFAALYLPLAILLRCPQCNRHVTVQWTTNPPYSEKVRGLNGWSAVIVSAAIDRKFRCMYCGQRFHVT